MFGVVNAECIPLLQLERALCAQAAQCHHGDVPLPGGPDPNKYSLAVDLTGSVPT